MLSCPKNFSAQSDPVLFCASDNKRLELEIKYVFTPSCIVHASHVKSLASKIPNVPANGDSSFTVSVER